MQPLQPLQPAACFGLYCLSSVSWGFVAFPRAKCTEKPSSENTSNLTSCSLFIVRRVFHGFRDKIPLRMYVTILHENRSTCS